VESPPETGPAANVWRRGQSDRRAPEPKRRPYPLPVDTDDDPRGDAAALAATRALLHAFSRDEVALILRTAVDDLGGAVVPARIATDGALPVDVSLGVGEPAVVEIASDDPAYDRLMRHLTALVHDAHAAATRVDLSHRQERRATVDGLTGVASRGEVGLRLGRAVPGDVVCAIDLDGFKELNDLRGHAAGDEALRDFGLLLRQSIRTDDFAGRNGGDEFTLVLRAADTTGARGRMAELIARWSALGAHGTTASVGVAEVDARGGAAAARAADAALYRAKRAGRGRVALAGPEDYRGEV
jgi:diguanylate cyclase (GGDEF)-like protein